MRCGCPLGELSDLTIAKVLAGRPKDVDEQTTPKETAPLIEADACRRLG